MKISLITVILGICLLVSGIDRLLDNYVLEGGRKRVSHIGKESVDPGEVIKASEYSCPRHLPFIRD